MLINNPNAPEEFRVTGLKVHPDYSTQSFKDSFIFKEA